MDVCGGEGAVFSGTCGQSYGCGCRAVAGAVADTALSAPMCPIGKEDGDATSTLDSAKDEFKLYEK